MSVGHKWIPSFDTCGKLNSHPTSGFFVLVISHLELHSWIKFKLPMCNSPDLPAIWSFQWLVAGACMITYCLSVMNIVELGECIWPCGIRKLMICQGLWAACVKLVWVTSTKDLHEEPFVILTTVWWRLYCVFAILVISSCTLAGSHTSRRQ